VERGSNAKNQETAPGGGAQGSADTGPEKSSTAGSGAQGSAQPAAAAEPSA